MAINLRFNQKCIRANEAVRLLANISEDAIAGLQNEIADIFRRQLAVFNHDSTAVYQVTDIEGRLKFITDDINRQGGNRVIPIFPEEQILFGGLIEDALRHKAQKQRLHIIEPGVGSGVLSIIAAHSLSHRNIEADFEVFDINERAIFFAIVNACLNGVKNITFHHEDFAKAEIEHKADVIIMNPPYNPTWSGIEPKNMAQYASAGPLGQNIYNSWLEKSRNVFKADGLLLGHMMFPCSKPSGVDAIEGLFEESGNNARIDVVDHFGQAQDSRQFLNQQYHDVESKLRKPAKDNLHAWVNSFRADYPYLRLVSFAAFFNDENPNITDSHKFSGSNGVCQLGGDWEKRIELHQHIVNATQQRARN